MFAMGVRPNKGRWPLHAAQLCVVVAVVIAGLSALAARADIPAQPPALRITDLRVSYPASDRVMVLEDPAGTLRMQDVVTPTVQARFRAAATDSENQVNFGYSTSAWWLKLPVRVETAKDLEWFLEIAFPSLDRITLFQETNAGQYSEIVAGDLLPFKQRPVAHRNFVFPVTLTPNSETTLYLRVQSVGSLTIPITVWESRALLAHDQGTYSLLAVYYGMLIALALYNLLIYFSTHDRVFLNYVAFVLCMAIGQASWNGFGNQFLWPEFPAWGNLALPVGMAFTGMAGALFTRRFLSTAASFPKLDHALLAFAALFLIAALSPLVAPYRFSAMLTSFTGLSFACVAVAIGIYCDEKNQPGARYFLIAWSLLLLGVGVVAARNFGWVPTNAITTYAMQIGSALEMVLLSFALSDRLSSIRREKERAANAALAQNQQLVASLQSSERLLEERVAARTRELEESIQSLREKEQRLGYLASHDQLTGLANRTTFHDRTLHSLRRVRRHNEGLAVAMVDVDNFKLVNDQFGHLAGDALLCAVGEKLKEAVRAVDTVARWGGDEFVVLLENVNNLADAEHVADKLVSAVAGANTGTDWSASPIHATVSVGIAKLPEHGTDAHQLLIAADVAMYRAKAAGKNQWRWPDDDLPADHQG
jgi:diguanylate cyclase (GGDEF)-like protein